MLFSAETPPSPSRPLPPAKARRAIMLNSSTPPPAYNSPFTFPSRRHPDPPSMDGTFHMMGWNGDSPPSSSSPPLTEELEELLVAADNLIKDREREFDFDCESPDKNLYENLSQVARSPMSSFSSSPDGPPHMMPRTLNYSTSDSALSVLIASPHPSLLRRLDQKVTADISLLADQNAQLLDKLEKLEAGTSSADQTGRRELKRLEKEIGFLRDAFEKTQAKSEELEEKVHDAVAGEAWRKKQEREAKFRAMRYGGRYIDPPEDESKVKNFAPNGSMFGGPSERFSFLPAAMSPNPLHTQESNSDMELELSGLFPHSEHTLLSQLMAKVQELEEANAQILKRQNETATQLSAVQRDTEHMANAYESLAEPEARNESDVLASERSELLASTETVKFRSIERSSEAQSSEGEESFVARDFILASKDRKSVMGLFPHEYPSVTDSRPGSAHNFQLSSRPSSPSCSEPQHRLSWSSTGSRGPESSGAPSPLHFFSCAPPELSPLGSRPTLQSELSKEFGDSWDVSSGAHHRRTSSLYDLSQFSVPATPSPASRAPSRRASDELDFEVVNNDGLCTSVPMTAGLLRLSVEPPTPVKTGDSGEYPGSPRVQRMSETLRSRTGRWVDRRFKEGHKNAKATSVQFNRTESTLVSEPTDVGLPQLLSNAIDKMIGKFDGLPNEDVDNPKPNGTSPSLPNSNNALQLQHATSPPTRKETLRKTNVLGNLLFQVWLWFQFTIIIVVFIYAMAKRGPKVMLMDSERKRPIARSAR